MSRVVEQTHFDSTGASIAVNESNAYNAGERYP
jgi:hypothetical protein